MIDKDTNSIKYILEEMDPAEKIEFERELEKNPDLHIEVESIRRMEKKLSQLPKLTPPEDVTNSILDLAAQQTAERSSSKSRYLLSAAVLILGLTTGSFMIENPFQTESGSSDRAASGLLLNQQILGEQNSASSSTDKQLKPWVDRQDILHLNGFENNVLPVNTLNSSSRLDKLRPVERMPSQQSMRQSLQLTGSNR
ncbi:MAG: anti-sigma factor family protein [Bacteroidota bacterium]